MQLAVKRTDRTQRTPETRKKRSTSHGGYWRRTVRPSAVSFIRNRIHLIPLVHKGPSDPHNTTVVCVFQGSDVIGLSAAGDVWKNFSRIWNFRRENLSNDGHLSAATGSARMWFPSALDPSQHPHRKNRQSRSVVVVRAVCAFFFGTRFV